MEVKRIANEHVLKISSGQVIVSLASATKELIENSLDAGATNIEVTITNHGLDSVEVRDNGKGIPSDHYNDVASRYTTSKLVNVDDLTRLQSYGFRGEGLNSLCSVAKITAVTRTSSDAAATALAFGEQGDLLAQVPVAGGVGTTIKVSELFHSLPVRRNDLTRNSKREYAKLLALIQSYAIICFQTSFTVSHVDKKGERSKVLHTPGKGDLGDSLGAIFGKRFLTTLMKFDCKLHDVREASISGYVSINDSKACKTNASQQFTFMNGRPVDLPKLSRVVNECYRQVNPVIGRHLSFPVFIFNITIPPDMVDWNMSPDKRTVLFVDQDHMLQTLKGWLCRRLDPDGERTFELQILPPLKLPPPPPTEVPSSTPNVSRRSSVLEHSMDIDQSNASTSAIPTSTSPMLIPSPPESARALLDSDGAEFHVQPVSTQPTQQPTRKQQQQQQQQQEETDLASFEPPFKKPATVIVDLDDQENEELHHREVMEMDTAEMDTHTIAQSQHEETTVSESSTRILSQQTGPTIVPQTSKINSIDAILERYQKQSSEKPRSQLISALDAFCVGSTQSRLPNLKDIASSQSQRPTTSSSPPPPSAHVDRLPIAVDVHEPESPVSDLPFSEEQDAEVKSETSIEFEEMQDRTAHARGEGNRVATSPSSFRSHSAHVGCGHGCSHGHHTPHPNEESHGVDEQQQEQETTLNAAVGRQVEVEMDLPSTFDIPVSQIVGATRPKVSFNMTRFSERYRAREARLAHAAEQQREFQAKFKTMDPDQLQSSGPKRIGNRTVRKFSAISSYSSHSDKKARDEMTRQVSKSDFANMIIIGQFNKAFIIAKLDDELFILDQHACDEKFNFEALCKQRRIHIQRLVVPKTLELPPPEVDIVLSNMDEFTSRGFRIEVAEDAESAINRLKLVGFVDKKSSLNVMEQIQEIIEAAREGVSAVTKLPSEYKANATEACRMSIMFGKPLGLSKMRAVVKNMATMNQPWNCPHGRPTMRHLMSLVGKNGK